MSEVERSAEEVAGYMEDAAKDIRDAAPLPIPLSDEWVLARLDRWSRALRESLPDPSGIEPAGVSDGVQREHPVIRVEPRERLVAGLVAWAMLEPVSPPFDDPDWYLKRVEELFRDVRIALDKRTD